MGTDPPRKTDRDTRTPRPRWQIVLVLAAILLVAAIVVELLMQGARAPITRNEAAQVMKSLRTVLPPESFDNEPHLDRILVSSPELPGSDEPLPVYRARLRGEPVAVVMTVVARHGYMGPITLLVAISVEGRIHAVRALTHSETTGLGDRIDRSRSDWIEIFNGRSLSDPTPERWKVRRDGGDFDQLTGATITSRAVVAAVHDAMSYFERHREEIFSSPAQ